MYYCKNKTANIDKEKEKYLYFLKNLAVGLRVGLDL